eukprot:TRINITY_DN8900_c0_g1_i1.p1 TRINITY_DN8900_c0_g1~~TRINITY_DN8900_c0_g1_i1.p1  ORF type:complete len:193 (-),score=28.54 TRINITY_DN8900_c0_g1_i1:68-646(-)
MTSSSSSQQATKLTRLGESAFNSIDKINSELLTLTYGAMVSQLIKDYKEVKSVNQELESMGYNIGVRLVDEFLAKSNVKSCSNFKETASVIAKVGLKMFLGISGEATNWREDGKQCSIVFRGNPLNDFVELPNHLSDLQYSNIICGVIRGALKMLQLIVECQIVKDELKGNSDTEIRLTLKEVIVERYEAKD